MLTDYFELPDADERLPAACVLQDDQVLAACNAHFARERPEGLWISCEPLDVLYDPGRQVRLAVALCDRPDVAYDRLWAEGQIVSLVHPVRKSMSRRGRVVEIGGHHFEAYLFPNDRRLRALRRVADREELGRLWQSWFGESVDLRRRFIRYVPEQKFITRLRPSSRTGAEHGPTKGIALRLTLPDVARELIRRHETVTQQTADASVPLHVPRVLGADAPQGLMAIKWIGGDMLLNVLRQDGPEQAMPSVAAAVRRFHELDVDDLPMVTLYSLTGSWDAAVADLIAAMPTSADRLHDLSERWRAVLGLIRDVPCVTLHHDLFWGQVRVHRDRYTLLDLERMAIGDPLLDVANFTQELEALSFRDELGVTPADAERWAAQFLEAWSTQSSEPIDPLRYGLYSSLTSLRMARGMMRHLRPAWPMRISRCIDAAETAMDATMRREVVR